VSWLGSQDPFSHVLALSTEHPAKLRLNPNYIDNSAVAAKKGDMNIEVNRLKVPGQRAYDIDEDEILINAILRVSVAKQRRNHEIFWQEQMSR